MKAKSIFHLYFLIALTFCVSNSSFAQITYGNQGPEIYNINGRKFQDWSERFEIRGPIECTPKAFELGEVIDQYQVNAYLDITLWSSKRHQKKIQEVLESLPVQDPCYHWIHGFYAMYAIHSFGYFSNDQYQSLFNIASELYYQERLIPFTQALRDQWGGVWKDHPDKILGAYQCVESKVYFDSTLPPYNLASVLAHEFEHVVRDKFSYDDAHVNDFVRNPELTLLLDETLSTIQAGYSQLAWVRDNNRDDANSTGRATQLIHMDENGSISLFHHKDQKHFQLSSDLNLYSKKGKLNQIFNNEISSSGLSQGLLFSSFLDRAILAHLETGDDNEIQFKLILKMVSDAYFNSNAPDPTSAVSELQSWKLRDVDYISPLGSLQLRAVTRTSATSTSTDPWFFNELKLRLTKPSAGCLKIADAIHRGKISHYIGSSIGVELSGEGVRTTGEGVRTTGEGVRTTGEGVRTTGEGVRTTGEGVRTDIAPAKPFIPCLKPDEKV